jgi:hypothetical protein
MDAWSENSNRHGTTQTLSQSEVSKILRQRRKSREKKACLPCHQRKVKCDLAVPCRTCRERSHPELCHYQRAPSRASTQPHVNSQDEVKQELPTIPETSNPLNDITKRLDAIDRLIQDLRADVRQIARGEPALPIRPQFDKDSSPETEASDATRATQYVHRTGNADDESVYLGGNSVPAMVATLGSQETGDNIQGILDDNVLPLLALKNESLTYPFVDLWGLAHGSPARLEALYNLVPTDSDCISYFNQYRDTAFVLYPGVVNIEQFEIDLNSFLEKRKEIKSDQDKTSEALLQRNEIRWLGLLFAILASGCQCSENLRVDRYLTVQVYGMLGLSKILLMF